MAAELIDRLDAVRSSRRTALVIGHFSDHLMRTLIERNIDTRFASPDDISAKAASGVQCDEDRLPFADCQFDLVIALSTLDTVNDLPGALTLIRRTLKPDGVFLGAMIGSGSLPALRRAIVDASSGETAAARTHPMVEVRAAGDLLARAGFALPVADADTIEVHYSRPERLLADIRANGLSNTLQSRMRFSRRGSDQLIQRLSATPLIEHFSIIYLTGWSPTAGSSE